MFIKKSFPTMFVTAVPWACTTRLLEAPQFATYRVEKSGITRQVHTRASQAVMTEYSDALPRLRKNLGMRQSFIRCHGALLPRAEDLRLLRPIANQSPARQKQPRTNDIIEKKSLRVSSSKIPTITGGIDVPDIQIDF
ncbi:hypothetical protein CC2G_014612 [Coprinopsis cinerea AmutBmut pab1-1]|nr:hypothetical protein CC2G_014612 [Coprinopsis cinerea AmutBmut pab1-1]